MNDSAVRQRLAALDRFDELSDREVRAILESGTEVNVPADWSLIWEKTPADKAYLILDGEVSVRRRGEEVARLGPGDTVGESAIVAHRLRSASVVSVTPLQVLHFTRSAVEQLIAEVPTFDEALKQTTRERLGDDSA